MSAGREVAHDPVVPASQSQRELIRRGLVVVDADSRRPLDAASLTWVDRSGVEPLWSAVPDVRADAEGQLAVVPVGSERLPLVRAPGYVPQFVDLASVGSETAEVAMRPAARIEVSVISRRGDPVQGAAVVLTSGVPDRFEDLTTTGIGHPLARSPRWQAVTDHTGKATIDEVPPGTLVLNVVHETMFPTDTAAWNASMDLVAGSHRVVATMAEAEAAVFSVPAKAGAESVEWRVDITRLSMEPMVTSRLGIVRKWLDQRFPGALIYVQKRAGADEEELLVRCEVVLSDRSRWSGAWPLTPVTQIAAPAYLEQQVTALKTITVSLRDADGREYAGIPIRLRPEGDAAPITTTTGNEVEVPHGTYRVGPTQFHPGVHQAFDKFRIEVGDASPFMFDAVLTEPVTEVQVKVAYPDNEVLGPLMLYFGNESGGPAVLANWRPERGEIRQWMTGGKVSLRVRSAAYEDVDIGPVATKPASKTVLEVALRVKN